VNKDSIIDIHLTRSLPVQGQHKPLRPLVEVITKQTHPLAKQRADLGAYYNRLEHAAKGLMNAYENTQAAESRIRDADMAEVTVDYTKNQILVQSGTAMLAHGNTRPQGVLQLLR